MTAVSTSTTSPAAKPLPSKRASVCLPAQPPIPTTARLNSPTSAIAAGPLHPRVPSSVVRLAQAPIPSPFPKIPNASSSARLSSSPPAGMARTSTHQTTKPMSLMDRAQALMVAALALLHIPSSCLRSCTNLCGMSANSPTKACGPPMAATPSYTV